MRFGTRSVVIGCWIAAAAIGLFLLGPLWAKTLIGLDPSGFLLGARIQAAAELLGVRAPRALAGPVWILATLLGLLLVVFLAVRGSRRVSGAGVDRQRRRLLSHTAAAVAAALVGGALALGTGVLRAFFGVASGGRGWYDVAYGIFVVQPPRTHPRWPEAWKGSRVRAYRRLGRTEFDVSDVALGAARVRGEQGTRLVREALERGVNYLDTAPDYSAAGSEEAIGRAIRGTRDRLFLATKFCTPLGHLPPGTPVREYVAAVEGSLGRLGTDYVDLVHVHACDELERLMDANLHEAFDRLREQGKVRFLGFSSHTPNLVRVAERAIRSGRFDVMMLAYHHGIWPELGGVIERARAEQDMGIVAMKTLKGGRQARLAPFRGRGGAYSQAALSWVLADPRVSCAVISFSREQHLDEYLRASGAALTPEGVAVLEEYDRLVAGSHCAPHCGECLGSCPEGLPIHDVLRYRMYHEDYGWPDEGERLYARLAKDASVCAGCPAPCLGACPIGVAVADRMRRAHLLLSGQGGSGTPG